MTQYVQFGCGLNAPDGWLNFDASPTLRIQRIPLIGKLLTRNMVTFPTGVKVGNIVEGLPGIKTESCDGIYSSHVLEHLSLNDCRRAIAMSYSYLKPGGVFRCILPDLEAFIAKYNRMRLEQNEDASIEFMHAVLLGQVERKVGLKGLAVSLLGHSHHLWMWDRYALARELKNAGFSSVREAVYKDSADKHFHIVDDEYRFNDGFGLEAIK
ncbi:class I SAM-dependent methyltransferase [Lacibacter sp. H407]|uniref:class I SAM-dependent methyltransferase n=1 Tax=Lacibacter sp. H407 TaxID=3133423 RepID=UPI0030C5B65B